jgi:hypothetical protein
MPGRLDLDLYNALLGLGCLRERRDLVRATLDPGFAVRARRALFPLALIDRPRAPRFDDALPPFRRAALAHGR